jgi:hypothetical protein
MRYEVIVRAHGSSTIYWLDADDKIEAHFTALHMWIDDNPGVPDGMIEEVEVTEL